MRLDTGLFQQQAQKQILSPQMIQSMEILVLNQQQLEERISEELESNVALERVEAEGQEKSGEDSSLADIEIEGDSEAFEGHGELDLAQSTSSPFEGHIKGQDCPEQAPT